MEFSIDSIYNFLRGHEEEAIRILYQKNKYIIIKKNEYLKTLQIIKELREELELDHPGMDVREKEQNMELEEVYQWRQSPYNNSNYSNLPELDWHSERHYEQEREREREPYLKKERISERDQSEEEASPPSFHEPLQEQKKMVMVKQEEKMERS